MQSTAESQREQRNRVAFRSQENASRRRLQTSLFVGSSDAEAGLHRSLGDSGYRFCRQGNAAA